MGHLLLGKMLWEILVPCEMNGRPARTRHHKGWDEKIRRISGGLTVYKPGRGQWVNSEGTLHEDRVIPVRVCCTESELNKILDITLEHYNQEAIFAYLVSERVIIKERDV